MGGLSESGHNAVPAAGLAQTAPEPPDYVKQIHAAHAEVAALYEMAQTFSSSLDVQDVVTLTVNRLGRMIPFTTCAVYLRQPDDSSLAAYCFGRNAEQIRGRSLAGGHGIVGWVVINGRPMTNTDPMLDLNQFLGDNEAGYRTAAVLPLTDGRETIGALALYSNELDSYSSDHLHLLESVSGLASTALRHAMLHEQTKAIAQTDALTGLPNGRALYAQLDEAVARAEKQQTSFTVLCFNLTGLRAVNESFGYQAGDRMLAEVAGRLRRATADAGLLSRIAGDEFVCQLNGSGRKEAIHLAEKARNQISSFRLEVRPDEYAQVGVSFGIAEYPADGRSNDELLQAASLATRQTEPPTMTLELTSQSLPPAISFPRGKSGPLALVR